MRYISTRGNAPAAQFSEIILKGLAEDGGLYVPESWPQISRKELDNLAKQPYYMLASVVLSKFAPEIPFNELTRITQETYNSCIFGNARQDSDVEKIFPLRKLAPGLYLLELSNGPTLAFKDAALQLLGRLLCWKLEKQGRTLTILGATSGDTGSAAIHALRGRKHITVVMLSPAGRMSAFQRAQMYSVQDSNILNIAVRGTFDDCQDLVKALNADTEFKSRHNLGAVNSINWARIAAQIVYYISAYIQCAEKNGGTVSFAVPSGNFGNAYSGLAAKLMGIPIERIIVATNENDVLYQTLMTGKYSPGKEALITSSPSMDITKASNFERALFEATKHNGQTTMHMMQQLQQYGYIDLAADCSEVWQSIGELGLCSSSHNHSDRIRLIQKAHQEWGIFIDPHTANGLSGALALRKSEELMIALETAQAAKFAETINEAVGLEPKSPPGFEELLNLPQKVTTIDANVEELKSCIEKWISK